MSLIISLYLYILFSLLYFLRYSFLNIYVKFRIDRFPLSHITPISSVDGTIIEINISVYQRSNDVEKKERERGIEVTSDEYFRENFSEDRPLARRRISKLFRFGCHFGSRSVSRYHPRASTGSFARGKGLNNVARHKGQVSCAARHSRHFCEERTESLFSALLSIPSSFFRPRSSGKLISAF